MNKGTQIEIRAKTKKRMRSKEKLKYYREAKGWFEALLVGRDGGGDASRNTVEKLLPA